jgi:MOSC domain-containing protein YiiM
VLGIGANFGVYADVIQPGTISVGDTVRVSTNI